MKHKLLWLVLICGISFPAASAFGGATSCTITCPGNNVLENDSDQCGAVAFYPPPTTTGTCGTITCTPASGSFYPVGTTTTTCNTEAGPSCTFTVTVNDTQPPFITCPADIDDVVSGPTVETFATPNPSDNCPGVTAACVPPSGSTFPVDTTTDTCTATDVAGNTTTCSFTITLTVPTPSPSPTPSATPIATPTPIPTGEELSGSGCALQKHSTTAAPWNFLTKALRR